MMLVYENMCEACPEAKKCHEDCVTCEEYDMAVIRMKALDTMCKRCINYEVCQGTGCQPKKTLTETILKGDV